MIRRWLAFLLILVPWAPGANAQQPDPHRVVAKLFRGPYARLKDWCAETNKNERAPTTKCNWDPIRSSAVGRPASSTKLSALTPERRLVTRETPASPPDRYGPDVRLYVAEQTPRGWYVSPEIAAASSGRRLPVSLNVEAIEPSSTDPHAVELVADVDAAWYGADPYEQITRIVAFIGRGQSGTPSLIGPLTVGEEKSEGNPDDDTPKKTTKKWRADVSISSKGTLKVAVTGSPSETESLPRDGTAVLFP